MQLHLAGTLYRYALLKALDPSLPSPLQKSKVREVVWNWETIFKTEKDVDEVVWVGGILIDRSVRIKV